MLEYGLRGHMPLIGYPYDDSSAAYLGTAILMILSLLYLLNDIQMHRLIGHSSALGDTDIDQWLTSLNHRPTKFTAVPAAPFDREKHTNTQQQNHSSSLI